MLGNSKMNADQLNRCVKRYHFLSPTVNCESFSSFSQRTDCSLSSRSYTPENSRTSFTSTKWSSPFAKVFSVFRASCEANTASPKATDRMERAKESLKQAGAESSSIVSEMEIQNYLAKETGKDRLVKMFRKDHIGRSSPEFMFMYQVTLQSAAVTFLVVTIFAGRQAKQEFIERNRATVFNTRFQAFRRLQDAIFLFSMKEGVKWAARITLFTLSFLGISQSIAVYRNKSSPWEYSIAAGATMGVLKANMGLRGFVVGTAFGAVMGLMMGCAAVGAMKAFNETQEQRHYWQIQKELEMEKLLESKGSIPEAPVQETA